MTIIPHKRPLDDRRTAVLCTGAQFSVEETQDLGLHLKKCQQKKHVYLVGHSFNTARGFMSTRIITSVMLVTSIAYLMLWVLT